MNYYSFLYLITTFLILSLCSCKNNTDSRTISYELTNNNNEQTEVKIRVLDLTDFCTEIISNGKLTALRKADLKFRLLENLVDIKVMNGEKIRKGQVLARLDDFSLLNTLNQKHCQFDKAKIELQNILIGQGYSINDTATIPIEILKIARVTSGYDLAFNDVKMSEYNLQASILKAPFNGIVADLFSKENNQSNISDIFCTIIDDSRFEAEFAILENELANVHLGQIVTIIPFAYINLVVKGEINQINPVVDNTGMVKVKAVCNNPYKKLVEGMNVKIIIKDKVPNQLVIPRQALVLRGEKQVVFTLSSGHAKWNYVKTRQENSTSYTIINGLSIGDSVIYEGNVNLAHDTRVKIAP
jgi:multidrug efflux pump subunit AcrA (membrane-fusion protein)